MIGTILGLQAMRFIGRTSSRLLVMRIEGNMRAGLISSILNKAESENANSRVGDLMSRAQSDVSQIGNAIATVINRASDGIVLLLANLVALLIIDWQITILAAIPLPIVAVLSHIFGKKLFNYSKAVQQATGTASSRLQQLLVNIGTLRLMGREETESKRYDQSCQSLARRFLRLTFFQDAMGPGLGLLCGIGTVLVLLLGGRHVAQDVWTVGDFIAYLSLFVAFAEGAPSIIRVVTQLHVSGAAWNRIKEHLHTDFDQGQHKDDCTKSQIESIEVQNLCFSFPGSSQFVLKDVSFSLQRGQILGLTGSVGSGKSALLLALTGLYPYEGSILVDGQELRNMPEAKRIQCFGYTGHEAFLFSNSVDENIRFGQEANDTHLQTTTKMTALDFDIAHFDNGLETIIGERGIKLSGGQRQRVSLARSVYANAIIQLWDDPFAAVDVNTEASMLEYISKWVKDHILIISSHRLTALTEANHILLLKDGQIAEQGKHNELMSIGGTYKRIYEAQSMMERSQ